MASGVLEIGNTFEANRFEAVNGIGFLDAGYFSVDCGYNAP